MNLTTSYLGLQLKHPIIAGASPLTNRLQSLRDLAAAGASAIVLASLFEEQVRDVQIDRLKRENRHAELDAPDHFFDGSEAFAFGPDEYLEHIYRAKMAVDVPIIASLNARTPTAWADFARNVQQAGADAIELNLYFLPTDANVTAAEVEQRMLDIVGIVREHTTLPLAVKLSPFFSSLPNFVARLNRAGVQAVVLFNRSTSPTSTSASRKSRRSSSSPTRANSCCGCAGSRFSADAPRCNSAPPVACTPPTTS